MLIYFMRHGETNYNTRLLCNDDPSKDVHLTEQGIQQANIIAEKLKDKNIEKIFVSELPRTRETAEIVNQHHQAIIVVNSLINDIVTGFDSLPVADYQQSVSHDPLHAKPKGGESLLEYKQRVLEFIHWLENQSYDSVLVVAHEETLRVISAYFNRLADEEMPKLHFDNCEFLQFEVKQEKQ